MKLQNTLDRECVVSVPQVDVHADAFEESLRQGEKPGMKHFAVFEGIEKISDQIPIGRKQRDIDLRPAMLQQGHDIG